MKNKINQEINIDNIEEYLYNNSKIPKFTYEDILIEHQTKIDYSMPYRIIEYKYKIIKSAVDIRKLKQKEILAIMLNLTLRRKIKNDKITDKLIKKLKNEGGEEMLAIFDTISVY